MRDEEERSIEEIIEAAVKWNSADADHPDTPPATWQAVIPLLAAAPRIAEAATQVLGNIVDSDSYGPGDDADPDVEWPRDPDGDPWYPDLWELNEALKAVDDKVFGQLPDDTDLPPPAETLPERAREIAKLVELNAPAVIVASRIACFAREASRVYGDALDLELGLMLAAIKKGKSEY